MIKLAIVVIVLIIFFWYLSYCLNARNVFKTFIYLDSNGTTPIHKTALLEYINCSNFGNASTDYASAAKDIIRNAQGLVKHWLKSCKTKVIFNSGASEGNNFVLRSCSRIKKKPHFILSSIEHKTSLDCAKELADFGDIELSLIAPDSFGVINPRDIEEKIKDNTLLISVMHINNELGSINDIYTIGQIAKKHNIFFHVDAVQSFGKYSFNFTKFGVSALTASMHKLHGPQGVGILVLSDDFADFVKNKTQIAGSQFDGFRGGTENVPGIAAARVAMKITFSNRLEKNKKLADLCNYTIGKLADSYSFLRIYNLKDFKFRPCPNLTKFIAVILSPDIHSPNTLLFSFLYNSSDYRVCNLRLKKALYFQKVIVSIGSACNTKTHGASHVLKAIQAPFLIRAGTVRLSFNDYTCKSDILHFVKALPKALRVSVIKRKKTSKENI